MRGWRLAVQNVTTLPSVDGAAEGAAGGGGLGVVLVDVDAKDLAKRWLELVASQQEPRSVHRTPLLVNYGAPAHSAVHADTLGHLDRQGRRLTHVGSGEHYHFATRQWRSYDHLDGDVSNAPSAAAGVSSAGGTTAAGTTTGINPPAPTTAGSSPRTIVLPTSKAELAIAKSQAPGWVEQQLDAWVAAHSTKDYQQCDGIRKGFLEMEVILPALLLCVGISFSILVVVVPKAVVTCRLTLPPHVS
jgi:hypothetical protein